jgi:hypothetical protein
MGRSGHKHPRRLVVVFFVTLPNAFSQHSDQDLNHNRSFTGAYRMVSPKGGREKRGSDEPGGPHIKESGDLLANTACLWLSLRFASLAASAATGVSTPTVDVASSLVTCPVMTGEKRHLSTPRVEILMTASIIA